MLQTLFLLFQCSKNPLCTALAVQVVQATQTSQTAPSQTAQTTQKQNPVPPEAIVHHWVFLLGIFYWENYIVLRYKVSQLLLL